jgi:hypothetical protein
MARRDIQDLQSATLKPAKAANRLATLANASSAHNAIDCAFAAFLGKNSGLPDRPP